VVRHFNLGILKDNDVRLVTYVPDNVLTPLIKGVTSDNYFMLVSATREDEAIGTMIGAYMAGLRGEVMMQTSGFALLANALASLVIPYNIPAIMVVSERGTLGEFNIGQSLVARTMRPTPDAFAIVHHTLTDEAAMPFIVDNSIRQAYSTQAPVAFVLSPLLTGGNPAARACGDEGRREQRTRFGKDAQSHRADQAAGATAQARRPDVAVRPIIAKMRGVRSRA
jgi:sulfopyruvate decarboxylase TPP-binding subunit